MDKLFHFSSNTNVTRIKGSASVQYYSDAEVEDTPKSKPQELVVKKNNVQSSNFKLEGYATDDNSDNEQTKSTSKLTNAKVSKFFNLSKRQPNGDEGNSNEDEHTTEILIIPQDQYEKLKVKKSNSILQKAKKEVASILEKNNPYGQKNLKLRLISENRQVDSDAEVKKVESKNQMIDSLKNHDYRHLIFSNYIQESTFKKHLSLVYRGLVYANKCLKGPSDSYVKQKQVQITRPKSKQLFKYKIIPNIKKQVDKFIFLFKKLDSKGKTLFLDLDETLIHTCTEREGYDHLIQVKTEKGETSQIRLRIRPFCLEFLQKMTQFWDIYIFTASSASYAEAIINFIDPQRKYISGILNRSNCMETKNGFFIKDLRIASDSDLRYTLLVDNLAHSFGFQPDNGVPILEWHFDKQDQELKYLMNYLIKAAQSSDVREFNRQNLRLDYLINQSAEQLGI